MGTRSTPSRRTRARVAALAPALLISCVLALAACGGSSSPTSSTTASTASLATTTTRSISRVAASAYRATLAAYASCMRAQGVNVAPPRTLPNGEPTLAAPTNATHQQIFAALPKCRHQAVAALEAHHNLPGGAP